MTTRTTVSIAGAVIVVVIACILTVAPTPTVLGLDAGSLGALEVTIGAGLATVLLWNASRS